MLAGTILAALAVYVGVGLLFGVAFVSHGAAQVDHAARSTSVAFRLLILPGAMALWPYLLRRWLQAGRPAGGAA